LPVKLDACVARETQRKLIVFLFSSSGEITTREPLDRETKGVHELVLEARDQGTPSRAARVPLKVTVLDVNDNSPEIVDPQGDVVSVREEQPSGTEVARVRALDTDLGENASVTYSIPKGKEPLSLIGFNLSRRYVLISRW